MSTQTISSQTASLPVPVTGKSYSTVLTGFLAKVSAGASLTYNIEASCDDPTAPASTWTFTPMTNFTALTASIDGTLTGFVTMLRLNVTTYVSGNVVFQVGQPNQ